MSPLGGLLPLVLKLIPLGLICCILPHAAPTCDGHHRIRRRRSRSDPARPRRRDPEVPPGLAVAGTAIGWAEAGASLGLFPPGQPPGGALRAGRESEPCRWPAGDAPQPQPLRLGPRGYVGQG